MLITGATPVTASAIWGASNMVKNLDDGVIPGYLRLSEAVHAEGAKMLAAIPNRSRRRRGTLFLQRIIRMSIVDSRRLTAAS
jgi:2,4-dienoyl-CoA reductase-like NADH-dependent reductase (Old Yellow Enzyme family)